MQRRSAGWRPPHCPNPNCRYFKHSTGPWPFKRKGFYARETAPHRIQRFACRQCGRHFSTQTFSVTYWQKRPRLIIPIFSMVVGCMANRQIARALGCAPSTVAHHISRLGRHCLLFQARELERIRSFGEIVIDGFESFEYSQYHPFHHNLAVEVETGYLLNHTDSPLRRKGRMTAHQKRRRGEIERALGRPDPKAVEKGVRKLLEVFARKTDTLSIRSDDHRAYPRAMRRLHCRVRHSVTSSKERRDNRNPLWEVNLADLMIRHSTAAHKRETIAWAKRRQASAEKLSIFQVWRNYVKRRWEKGPAESSAMLKGLAARLLHAKDVLKRRYFRNHTALSPVWSGYYDRTVVTPALGVNRMHTLSYAY